MASGKIGKVLTAAVLCAALVAGTGNSVCAENVETQPAAAGETQSGGDAAPGNDDGAGGGSGEGAGTGNNEAPDGGAGEGSGGENAGTGEYEGSGENTGGQYNAGAGWNGGYSGDWNSGNTGFWSQGNAGTYSPESEPAVKDAGEAPLVAEETGQTGGAARVKLREDKNHLTSLKFGKVNGDKGTFCLTCKTKEKHVTKVQFSVWNDGDTYPFTYTAFRRGNGKYQVTGTVRQHDFFSGSYHAKALVYTEDADGSLSAVQSSQADQEISLGQMLYSKQNGGKKRREVCLVGYNDASEVEFSTRCVKIIRQDFHGTEADADGSVSGDTMRETGVLGEDGVWRVSVDRENYPSDGLYLTEAYDVCGEEKTLIGSTRYYLQNSDSASVEVPEILQLPELPTGCEAVSLTIVLRYLGFSPDKTTIAEKYLPYGSNMACSYVGSPFSEEGAGIYPPGIVIAANDYLEDQKSGLKAEDISGASMDELYGYIDQGLPVMVWHSMYMTPVEIEGESSTFKGKTYPWFITEHCVVLCGYDKNSGTVTVSDPLEGMMTRDAAAFEQIYQDIGQYAVVVKK
uniref:C39 family peptidase n=1 Tax=Eubacterium cellulosolvens TaxID=29322 RepID=UPI00138B186F|nr:C39 family peptidase [[Eubacterium] cellulosolvens]